MPSVSTLPIVNTASPPAVPSVANMTTYVSSVMDQWSNLLATLQQDVSSALNALGQEVAQEMSSVQQQWDHLLGINPTPPNPSPSAAVMQANSDSGAGRGNSSGAGSGTGAMSSAHSAANQALHNTTQQSGSGSGSGSSASTAHAQAALHGSTKVQPMDGGTGSPGSGVSGAGTGSAGGYGSYGTGYVRGTVWLDNNGDGFEDNGESGYSGATVEVFLTSTSPWTLAATTTTGSDGSYSMQIPGLGPVPEPFLVHVVFPNYMTDTYPTGDNMLNNKGNSSVFQLAAGGWREIKAGLLSMNVTTTQDDPNAPIQNQITLRDAIQTGNNGGGPWGLNVVTFFDSTNWQPLTGTITLQKALDDISRSYSIIGSGASTLAVSGANSFGDFAINAGITSTIYGLTIENGSAPGAGGGVFNNGNLTLNNDVITDNTSGGVGGGICNRAGSLKLAGVDVVFNSAPIGGGLYDSGGAATITGSVISFNKTGGGIYNGLNKMTVSGGTVINSNSSGADGGGVLNQGTFSMTGGEINGNTAGNPNGGGGLYIMLGGSGKLLGVQVEGNSAAKGGGIYTSGILLLAQNTNISNYNKASLDGAGIYVEGGTVAMVGGGVTNNTAQRDGGGIYVSGGQVTLSHGAVVSSNTAVGGGGIVAWGGGIFIKQGQVTMSTGTVSNNTATAWSGGGIYNLAGALTLKDSNISDNGANTLGGGIYLANASTTTFNGVIVDANWTNGNQQTTGWGVYQQVVNGVPATVFGLPLGLTDRDDPNGKPVQGP